MYQLFRCKGRDTMAKREIRINYEDFENSKADSIEKLEKRYKKVKKNLDACMEESDALYHLIRNYRVAMTGIIESKGGMTKVGR